MYFGYILQDPHLDFTQSRGPEIHVSRIIQHLQARGHRVRLVQLVGRGIRWSDDLVQWTTVPFPHRWRPMTRLVERPIRSVQSLIKPLPFFNYFDSLRFADLARTVLGDVDVLFERYHFMSYGGVLLSRMLAVPLLLEVNGHPFDEAKTIDQGLMRQQRYISTRLTRWTMEQATVVLPSGYGWKKRLIDTQLLTHDRVQVVWPGNDPDRFSVERDLDQLRDRWSLQDAQVISFTGAFLPWQGLDILVKAFSRVSRDYPDAVLVLAGDGMQRDEIEALVGVLGCSTRVIFTGRLPQVEVADLLAVTDIGVLSLQNRAEFVGMKLFDYMAAGVAIVVTAPQRKHDIIIHGATGCVVEPGNVEELADAIAQLLRDNSERRRLGWAAKDLAHSHHTWMNRAEEIEAIAAEHVPSN